MITSLFPHKINIVILFKYKIVIHTGKVIAVRGIDKCVVTAGVADIPEFNKYIGLLRPTTHLSFRDIYRVRVKVLGIDASVVIHSINKKDISAVGTHPPSNEFLIGFFCGL